MQNNWNSYRLLVDDEPASIFVDLGIGRAAPPYDQMAYLRLRMLKPTEDGLSSQEEFDDLSAIEDRVTGTIIQETESVYVGRSTSGGKRDFYFYTNEAEKCEAMAARLMAAFPDYPFITGARPDPEWRAYHEFLYPSLAQMEQIKNHYALDQLQKKSDKLTALREIDHYAYFPDPADCKAFSLLIREQGFAIRPAPISSGTPPYGLRFYRMDKPAEMQTVTPRLSQAVTACRGEYDGWECPVIR